MDQHETKYIRKIPVLYSQDTLVCFHIVKIVTESE